MRKKIVAANWKMNKSLSEADAWMTEFIPKFKNFNCEVIVSPPFTHLASLVEKAKKTSIKISAQNCAYEKSGAFTGEVSTSMLSAIGVEYVILGHSERRTLFGEKDEIIAKKIRQALGNNLKVISCIGETKSERGAGMQFEVVKSQLENTLKGLDRNLTGNIVIAYEPVWAIGTGITASPMEAQEMHVYIRNEFKKLFSDEAASVVRILYGGSCNSKNAKEVFSRQDIDGGLIGGASLVADEFIEIINAAC